MENEIKQKLYNMTLEQKIGQLIVGETDTYEMTPEFEAYIKKYQICGYKMSGISIKDKVQVKTFTDAIKKIYSQTGEIEPLLACDQEGGSLSVFGNLVTEFPGNMSLGAAGDPELAYLQGNISGYELAQLGMQMAFAPVADLNLKANNPVIGVRSFGDDPSKVTEFCKQYAEGLNAGGVGTCAKHFPGHGNTDVDSHLALPANFSNWETFSETELVPFVELAAAGVDSFMVSHVLYPNITGDRIPASLSYKIINGILRRQLNYKGVIMTDDLQMRAILNHFSMGQAVRLFIQAGGDIALINASRKLEIEAYDSLYAAASMGLISMNTLDEAVTRVLILKGKISAYYSGRKAPVENPQVLSEQISKKAVTLVRDHQNLLPLKTGSKVLLVVPDQINLTPADTTGGMENNLFKYMKHYCPDIQYYRINLNAKTNMEELLTLAQECDEVVQCTINCNRFPEQVTILEQVGRIKPVLAIMVRDPYDVMLIPEDIAVVAAYSAIDSNMSVTCDLIFGKYDFEGQLPVNIHLRSLHNT